MNKDGCMRLVAKQLRRHPRLVSVEGRVIGDVICIDVQDTDGDYFAYTGFSVGKKSNKTIRSSSGDTPKDEGNKS